MANKPLVLIFLIFTLIPLCFSLPLFPEISPFAFLNGLQGCKKGDHLQGISKLKNFFRYYGYLNHLTNTTSPFDDDSFDDPLESAIKTYQQYFHLSPTGSLSPETISQLATPRCGVPDIVNRTTGRILLSKHDDDGDDGDDEGDDDHHHHHLPHAVSHYAFFPGKLRWPSTKYSLTYAFLPGTRVDAKVPVARAFATWARYTHFKFYLTTNYKKADLKIGFYGGNHGDGYPFDGPGGTLAHAFAPTDGRFHYDSTEKWAVGAVKGRYDLQTVALHEIGHLLGLGHSTIQNAIMYPYINSGATKGLNVDDIKGIKVLYNR